MVSLDFSYLHKNVIDRELGFANFFTAFFPIILLQMKMTIKTHCLFRNCIDDDDNDDDRQGKAKLFNEAERENLWDAAATGWYYTRPTQNQICNHDDFDDNDDKDEEDVMVHRLQTLLSVNMMFIISLM